MLINELLAETIVNKVAALINREILFTDVSGNVLASTDLAKTNAHYSQMQRAAESGQAMEVVKDDFSFSKYPLDSGVILPLTYNGEIVGTLYVQDEPSNYSKYSNIIKTTTELLIYQTLVIDNVPYKDRIKDNFIFGLLHRKLSWDDSRTYDEAELLEVSLLKDKVVTVVYAPGFWQSQFTADRPTSEDERQSRLHSYKKKIYEAVKQFFGDDAGSGTQISYFGNDTFVVLTDETAALRGTQMVETLRKQGSDFNKIVAEKFAPEVEKIIIGVGNFYKGKDGITLAYEEAKIALQLGMNFVENKAVYHIDDLGMIAVLAGGNKRWQENFVRNLLTKLMTERYLLETVDVFFDQNMSLTQTAKSLKIHRNTLLYRLSKVKKITGLDPRKFNDAVKIRLASILNTLLEKERI
jgi:carbohydrate diacid regulator